MPPRFVFRRGQHQSSTEALAHCETLLKQGADILDIGGESGRPGAPVLGAEEEWQRVVSWFKKR